MHVGKNYPFLIPDTVTLAEQLNYRPPRKHSHQCFVDVGPGSMALQWTPIYTSGILYKDPADPMSWISETVNGVDSNNVLKIRLKLIEGALPSLPGVMFHSRCRCEVLLSGTVMGWFERDLDWQETWGFGVAVNTFASWNSLVNPALFRSMQVHKQPASWAQQPEYHPYRH